MKYGRKASGFPIREIPTRGFFDFLRGSQVHGATLRQHPDLPYCHVLGGVRDLVKIADREIAYIRGLILACAADPAVPIRRDRAAVGEVMRQVADCIALSIWSQFEAAINENTDRPQLRTLLWRNPPFMSRRVRAAAQTIGRLWAHSAVFEADLRHYLPNVAEMVLRDIRRRHPRRKRRFDA